MPLALTFANCVSGLSVQPRVTVMAERLCMNGSGTMDQTNTQT